MVPGGRAGAAREFVWSRPFQLVLPGRRRPWAARAPTSRGPLNEAHHPPPSLHLPQVVSPIAGPAGYPRSVLPHIHTRQADWKSNVSLKCGYLKTHFTQTPRHANPTPYRQLHPTPIDRMFYQMYYVSPEFHRTTGWKPPGEGCLFS